MSKISEVINAFYEKNILAYINMYKESPIKLVSLIIDVALVFLLIYLFVRMVKEQEHGNLLKELHF